MLCFGVFVHGWGGGFGRLACVRRLEFCGTVFTVVGTTVVGRPALTTASAVRWLAVGVGRVASGVGRIEATS
jgi:hypothetical protein